MDTLAHQEKKVYQAYQERSVDKVNYCSRYLNMMMLEFSS